MNDTSANQFCRRTRREFLWEAGAGFGALGLTGLLRSDPLLRARARRRRDQVRQPDGAEEADAPGEGQDRHLPVHVRRAEPGRHVRLQARTLPARRQDDPREDVRPRRAQERGPRRRAEVAVQALRQVRQAASATCSRTSARASTTSRSSTRCTPSRRSTAPAMLMMNSGRHAQRQPVPRLVGHVRPRQREREPARLRRDARQDRRADQRAEELVERLHAGRVPGRVDPRRQTPIHDLALPAGHDAASSSATCSIGCKEKNEEHLATRSRQQRTGGPHRQLRTRVQDAGTRPGGGRLREGDRRRRRSCTASTTRRRTTSAASACSPAGWSSAACGSSRSTPAAPTTTTTGTPTRDMVEEPHASTPATPTSRSPGCSKDLKRRGLLDSTIVVWGGEFGRQPTAEYATGHRPRPQRLRLHDVAGRRRHQGRRSASATTDELGNAAVDDRFHVKNLHATVLHQMGLDPNKLTYFYGGLDQKLVGVEGAEPIKQLI